MKQITIILSVTLAELLLAALAGCATSPTGRSQLKLFPDAEMERMGITAYEEMKGQTPLVRDRMTVAYVTCVADAVAAQTGANYDWEVNVFDDKAVNAFALPGGKIGVYTGLLEVATTQDQLAAVIGHELAHVIAGHGNERVSVAYATETGLQLAEALAGAASQQKSQLLGLLGLGAQVGILLPYSRTQESEADLLGMDYMAQAGFDPEQSITLWRNMERQGGAQPPELLSTHPSSGTRIENLTRHLSQARNYYEQARRANRVPQCR